MNMVPERNLSGHLCGTRAVSAGVLVQFSHSAGPKLGLQVARDIAFTKETTFSASEYVVSPFNSTSNLGEQPQQQGIDGVEVPADRAEEGSSQTTRELFDNVGASETETADKPPRAPIPSSTFSVRVAAPVASLPTVCRRCNWLVHDEETVHDPHSPRSAPTDGPPTVPLPPSSATAINSDSPISSCFCLPLSSSSSTVSSVHFRRWLMRYILSDLQLTPDCYDGQTSSHSVFLGPSSSPSLFGAPQDLMDEPRKKANPTTDTDHTAVSSGGDESESSFLRRGRRNSDGGHRGANGSSASTVQHGRRDIGFTANNYGRLLTSLYANNASAMDSRYYIPQEATTVEGVWGPPPSSKSSSKPNDSASPTSHKTASRENLVETERAGGSGPFPSPAMLPYNQQFGLDWNWKIITLPETDVSLFLFLFSSQCCDGDGRNGAQGDSDKEDDDDASDDGDSSSDDGPLSRLTSAHSMATEIHSGAGMDYVTALAVCVETRYVDLLYAHADTIQAIIIGSLHRPARLRRGLESDIFGAEGITFATPSTLAEMTNLCECIDQLLVGHPTAQISTHSMQRYYRELNGSDSSGDASSENHLQKINGNRTQKNKHHRNKPLPDDICVENSHFVSLEERNLAWIQKFGIALTAALLARRVIVYGENSIDVRRMVITLACLMPRFRYEIVEGDESDESVGLDSRGPSLTITVVRHGVLPVPSALLQGITVDPSFDDHPEALYNSNGEKISRSERRRRWRKLRSRGRDVLPPRRMTADDLFLYQKWQDRLNAWMCRSRSQMYHTYLMRQLSYSNTFFSSEPTAASGKGSASLSLSRRLFSKRDKSNSHFRNDGHDEIDSSIRGRGRRSQSSGGIASTATATPQDTSRHSNTKKRSASLDQHQTRGTVFSKEGVAAAAASTTSLAGVILGLATGATASSAPPQKTTGQQKLNETKPPLAASNNEKKVVGAATASTSAGSVSLETNKNSAAASSDPQQSVHHHDNLWQTSQTQAPHTLLLNADAVEAGLMCPGSVMLTVETAKPVRDLLVQFHSVLLASQEGITTGLLGRDERRDLCYNCLDLWHSSMEAYAAAATADIISSRGLGGGGGERTSSSSTSSTSQWSSLRKDTLALLPSFIDPRVVSLKETTDFLQSVSSCE